MSNVCKPWVDDSEKTNISPECIDKIWRDVGCITQPSPFYDPNTNEMTKYTNKQTYNNLLLAAEQIKGEHKDVCYGNCESYIDDPNTPPISLGCLQDIWKGVGCTTEKIYNIGQVDDNGNVVGRTYNNVKNEFLNNYANGNINTNIRECYGKSCSTWINSTDSEDNNLRHCIKQIPNIYPLTNNTHHKKLINYCDSHVGDKSCNILYANNIPVLDDYKDSYMNGLCGKYPKSSYCDSVENIMTMKNKCKLDYNEECDTYFNDDNYTPSCEGFENKLKTTQEKNQYLNIFLIIIFISIIGLTFATIFKFNYKIEKNIHKK